METKEFTKNCIMDALVQLMHTKDYNDITITDITKRAGVSRMSYYRNYKSKDDILLDYMYRILKEYVEDLKDPAFSSNFIRRWQIIPTAIQRHPCPLYRII